MQDINIKRWLDSPAYEQQKAIIAREVNRLERTGTYAAISIGCPARLMHVDYKTFEKSIEEKGEIYTMKRKTPKKKLTLIGRYEF